MSRVSKYIIKGAASARVVIAAFLFGFVILSVTYCHTNTLSPKDAFLARVDSAKHYLNINDTVKYVGAHTCMLCHQNIYNSFEHTGMGESFDIATKQKSSAKFGQHIVVYDKYKDFYYHPFWKKDSLYVFEYRLKGHDTIYRHEQQINYIIGSGQHTNSHIYRVNGFLYQAPVTFYTQEGKWDLAPGFSDGFNSRFTREVGLECMSCHNSYPQFVMGSTNKYTGVPNGISCERCHGAGEMHVKAIQAGHVIDTTKAIDYTIVNPAKLSAELQVEVCERCHLQGNAVLKSGKTFYDFRPGMKLSDIMDVFMPQYEGMQDEYIMASHLARMKMSKCYLNSIDKADNKSLKPYKNSFTCVTCHNPHVDVRSVSGNSFNTICQNCHKESTNTFCKEIIKLRTETKIEPVNSNEERNNCIGCHMPKGKTIDIPHVHTTDHYIRIPSKIVDKEKVRKFITLYDVNNPHPTNYAKGVAFIQQFAKFQSDFPLLLDSAKKYFPDSTKDQVKKNFSRLVDISFYKNDFYRILDYVNATMEAQYVLDSMLVHKDYDNSDGWTAYHIGEAYYQNRDYGSAMNFYKKATELAPYVLEFQNKLAVSEVALGKLDEANKTYDFILTQDPEFISAFTNKGFIALRKGNASKAKEYYDRALSLDPDDKQAMLNTAGWYIYEKDYGQAEEWLNKVVKKYPMEIQAQNLLKELKLMHHKRAA